MSDRNQARSLLKMAFKDFKALRAMRDRQSFDDEIFGFHVQQSAEKALKAWIALLGIEYPYTHNIKILLQLLQSAGADVEDYWHLREYSVFAVQLRYQDMGSSDEPIDRETAITRAEEIVEHVRNLIERGDQP